MSFTSGDIVDMLGSTGGSDGFMLGGDSGTGSANTSRTVTPVMASTPAKRQPRQKPSATFAVSTACMLCKRQINFFF